MTKKYGKILASWSVPEFDKPKRPLAWYLFFGFIGLGLLIYAIITVNYLFALIIFLIGFIIYLREQNEPELVKFIITEKGIKLGKNFYSYKEIKNFFILYDPPEVKKLYFIFERIFSFRLMVPLKNQNPLKIRKILLQFLLEDLDVEEEPVSESVGRWLRL